MLSCQAEGICNQFIKDQRGVVAGIYRMMICLFAENMLKSVPRGIYVELGY